MSDHTADHIEPTGASKRVVWSDDIDDIFDGDLAIALAHVTPSKGVVITPLTNFALRSRESGTITVLSSLGAWKKLARLRSEPRVAVAFHTRLHGYSRQPSYVLAQGTASFTTVPDRAWLESIEANWVRFMGSRRHGPIWDRWLRVYHWERVGIEITVERLLVWPDLHCHGSPTAVVGRPLPPEPTSSQPPPGMGTAPRVNCDRLGRRVELLANTLLGWTGSDGFPMIVPVAVERTSDVGLTLNVANDVVPPGGRRAGITAHAFTAGVLGQEQHVCTGWLTSDASDPRTASYSPHTVRSYRLPPSRVLYRVLVGGFARVGLNRARRAGFLDTASTGTDPPKQG